MLPDDLKSYRAPYAISQHNEDSMKLSISMEQYNRALDGFRAASREFRLAQEQYRAKKIGDSQFLAARAEFNAASSLMDYAENAVKLGKSKR